MDEMAIRAILEVAYRIDFEELETTMAIRAESQMNIVFEQEKLREKVAKLEQVIAELKSVNR
jgi:tetrahydromethanopterin S-methyltransferase subunit B